MAVDRTIFVLLPAYNEEAALGTLLEKIRRTMEAEGLRYRVLVVDDGSNDGTREAVEAAARGMPVEVLAHQRNRGLWETIRDGFEWSADAAGRDDVIVRMDADDTHDPKYIPAMLAKLDEGYDVVIASRFQPGGRAEGLNAYRTFVSRCANLLMKSVFPIPGVWEYSCGYRAYRASLVKDALEVFGNAFIDLKGVGFTCTIEKLIRFRAMGARFAEVPFVLRYDQKVSASKMLTSITTLGYLILILKYIRPWGPTHHLWQERIALLRTER